MEISKFSNDLYFIGSFDGGRNVTAADIRKFAKRLKARTVCATSASNQSSLNKKLETAGFIRLTRGPRTSGPGCVFLWRRKQKPGNYVPPEQTSHVPYHTFCCGIDDVCADNKVMTHREDWTVRSYPATRIDSEWRVYGTRVNPAKPAQKRRK